MQTARSTRRGHTRTTAVTLAMAGGVAVLSSACGTASPAAPQAQPNASCRPSSDQQAALDILRAKALSGYAPDGVRPTKSRDMSADCTTDWPASRGAVPPAKHFAAIENDYGTATAMTSAQLVSTFGQRAVTAGWQPNGSWDDSQGDGSAYAVYCQQVNGTWSDLSIYRGPKSGDVLPIRVLVEAYPGVTSCPGRPQDG